MKSHHHIPRGQLLGTGITQRLAVAAGACAVLWATVYWALAQ
jgi:hypothetical protein